MKINSSVLEKKIKLKFKDQNILIKSLTHKSFDSKDNNEKIEFLGELDNFLQNLENRYQKT